MIDKTDIASIDTNYFEIIGIKDFGVALRSRCTGHFWYLLEQEYNGYRTFKIHHKHSASDPYHVQRNKPSISVCCDYIRDHDAYQLRKMQKKEDRKKRFE